MAFHEVQFPADISFGAVGGPQFKTTSRRRRSLSSLVHADVARSRRAGG